MTSNLDTQMPDLVAVEATGKKLPRLIRILDDADLDSVNGGEANLHNVAVRVVTQWFQDHTGNGFSAALYQELFCPRP